MSSRRFTVGTGIATLMAGVAGMLAPQTFAVAQELAPGVVCDGFQCTNDTDDSYRIETVVRCSPLEVSAQVAPEFVLTTYVGPHSSATVVGSCPAVYEPGTLQNPPPRMVPGEGWVQDPPVMTPGRHIPTYASVVRQSAVVDDNPPAGVPSGSAD